MSFLCLCVLGLPTFAQEVIPEILPFAWTKVSTTLPPSIQVFAGESYRYDGLPIRAWRVEVDYSDTSLTLRPFLSRSPYGKEAATALASEHKALLAVNGGYFDTISRPARTFSLVKSAGEIEAQNIAQVNRANGHYPVLRAAFGVRTDRSFALDWIGHQEQGIIKFAMPLPNSPTQISPPPNFLAGQNWIDVPDAIGGGPMLLKDGIARLTYEEEVFFGSGFGSENSYPRTAVGFTPDHRLILFITDGKQPEWSIGISLAQLANQMRECGCTDAMNLDGGGSTTLVIQDKVINRPSDGAERAVTSVLAIVSGQ